MAAIDVAGYVAEIKDHSVDHGFHVHDERHFVETYSLRQVWEVDLHPEEGCGGPLDLHLALDVDPRVLLSFEDAVIGLGDEEDAEDELAWLPLILLARLSSADDTHPPATSGSTSHAESSTRKAECKRRTFGWFKDRISEASRRSMSRAAESGMHSRLQTLMAQGRLPAVVWAR